MFSEHKIAQMGAFFIDKEGGIMPHLKLMKLMYLSDRLSMDKWGYPISYDCMVSMPHGPVLSKTLEYINGDSRAQIWNKWVSDKENHKVALNKAPLKRGDLDQLSDAEITILTSVWAEFGAMDQWQIRDYTHDSCKEWQDPNGSSHPISYGAVFIALGKDKALSVELQKEIEESKKVDGFFASL